MEKTNPNSAILILAAGASKRMGDIKQLLSYKNSTLLGHAIKQAISASNNVYVVLGANRDKIKKIIPNNVTIIQNKQWEQGMGTTIATGINTLREKGTYDAVLIMLADQPLIDSVYLKKMMEVFAENTHQIVATRYNSKNGVPAIFDKALFPELTKLDSDVGAQQLMKTHTQVIMSLDVGEKAIDIDTPESYLELLTPNNL